LPEIKRAVIFANGMLSRPEVARAALRPDDILIAADGGARLCHQLGLTPAILIGDFDSLDEQELAYFETRGSQIIRHPARKDYTDLELALRHALSLGVEDILIFAALGARWDHTLANLLLPAAPDLAHVRIRLADGPQEVMVLRGGSVLEISGQPGDTVSLIPLNGDALGITTRGLEYPLNNGSLHFGATRGISNVLLGQSATVSLRQGLLLCVIIHAEQRS
jgi:thiamine pyrophosphokinase